LYDIKKNIKFQIANIWAVILYWTLGLAFVALDVFNWPRWIRKYKVQPGTNEPADTKRVLEVSVIFGQYASY